MPRLVLDGTSLTLETLDPLFAGSTVTLALHAEAKQRVRAARAVVDQHVKAGNIVYGLTTGFGKLKSVAIDSKDLEVLQRNLIISHCTGVGAPMPLDEVRVVQVLRLNGILRGHSGVRLSVVEALVRLFNKGFVPEVPMKGSVGASGDLAPLAHMAATYLGEGFAYVPDPKKKGVMKRMPAKAALKAIDEAPLVHGDLMVAPQDGGADGAIDIMSAVPGVTGRVALDRANVIAYVVQDAFRSSSTGHPAGLTASTNLLANWRFNGVALDSFPLEQGGTGVTYTLRLRVITRR